jgi:sulfopyruvate decarboxylase subunit beta
MVREMLLVGRRDNHLYVLDSMGLPPAIGLGIALGPAARRFDKVIAIEGDGGLLMGFSTLATIGLLRPEKLLLVVLDNGAYAATGMQRTAAPAVDLCAAAGACGVQAYNVDSGADLQAFLRGSRDLPGPTLLRVAINEENRPAPYFLPDPVELTVTFQRYLSGAAGATQGPAATASSPAAAPAPPAPRGPDPAPSA